MNFQWWFIEHVHKIWWTFQQFIEHSLCEKMWWNKSHHIFLNIYNDNVHSLEWSDLYYSSIMMFKFNISLDSSCKTSVMWDIHQHKISWFCNNHWSHSTQNTTTMFFQANHSMLYKEVDVITWLEILCNVNWILTSICTHIYCQSCRLRWLHLIFKEETEHCQS
jgi:hypothetical protein